MGADQERRAEVRGRSVGRKKATSRRVAMMAPLVHEARAELKVVVLPLLVKNVGDFTRDSGHRRDIRLSPMRVAKVGYRDCKELCRCFEQA
jgi:hypothetical protein